MPAGVGSMREVVMTFWRAWGGPCKCLEGVREMAEACMSRACGQGDEGVYMQTA